jgi:hypothetical protein
MPLQYACEQAITEEEVELSNCTCVLDDTPWELTDLIDAATDALFQLSGGTVSGRCERIVRPCADSGCMCGYGWGCDHCRIAGINLPGFNPVVTEVKIDGDVIPPTEYAIVNGRKLARLGGLTWPGSKNPLLADTEVGSFSIAYTSGMPFDFIAKNAAIELVCEMAATFAGEGRLPAGTVSATADGIQIVVGRLPGREDVEAVGLTWLGKFMALHSPVTSWRVVAPELEEGWTLHTVEFSS